MRALAHQYAARYALGRLGGSDLIDAAQYLLDHGYCSPAIAALVSCDSQQPNLWYVQEKFESLLRELGITLPSATEAGWIICRQAVRSLIEDSTQTFDILNRIRLEFWMHGGDHSLDSAAYEMRDLIDCYSRYVCVQWEEEDYPDTVSQNSLQELETQVLELATAWNRKHSDPIYSSWRTATVVALAEAIYTDRAFDRLPILADALEEAGCADAAILEHCRGPGPHIRGCWVVDLLLGKS